MSRFSGGSQMSVWVRFWRPERKIHYIYNIRLEVLDDL